MTIAEYLDQHFGAICAVAFLLVFLWAVVNNEI